VPRCVVDPITTNDVNVTGFLNMLVAARDCKGHALCLRGQQFDLWRSSGFAQGRGRDRQAAQPLRSDNELYAEVFAHCHGFKTIGLRYFNVFGPRQDPDGAYAAAIPKWTAAMIKGEDQWRWRNQPRFLLYRQRGASELTRGDDAKF